MTRREPEHKMMVLLGGRAAEHVVFNQLSTGAADDLAKVTDIARSMVMRYGMTKLGKPRHERERSTFLKCRSVSRSAVTARTPRAKSTVRCARCAVGIRESAGLLTQCRSCWKRALPCCSIRKPSAKKNWPVFEQKFRCRR